MLLSVHSLGPYPKDDGPYHFYIIGQCILMCRDALLTKVEASIT